VNDPSVTVPALHGPGVSVQSTVYWVAGASVGDAYATSFDGDEPVGCAFGEGNGDGTAMRCASGIAAPAGGTRLSPPLAMKTIDPGASGTAVAPGAG